LSANECCGSSAGDIREIEVFDLGAGKAPMKPPEWIAGFTDTAAGPVPIVSTEWSRREKRGRLKCRFFNRFRMDYKVDPGVYGVGTPGRNSPILVTANYKLSFDYLRTALAGFDAWILVLDTQGINVWCAAGKGTFGSEELINRIGCTRLARIVDTRRLILPQLGAPGVRAPAVKAKTHFSISYGPVSVRDLPAYLRAGCQADAQMRAVRFGLKDRLTLLPMEVTPALKGFLIYLIASVLILGLQPEGILFRSMIDSGAPAAVLGLAALLCGTVLTPILLPWIPFRSFAAKGFLLGGAVTAALLFLVLPQGFRSTWMSALSLVFFPAASSYLALQFTGSTCFTGISGVRKELRVALPLYAASACLSLPLLVLVKLKDFGVIG